MNDSVAITQPEVGDRWLLLIHQIPPKPDYFRVKVRRRLQRLGAVALKNSVYVLPRAGDAAEDFEWLRREIVAEGGEATICEASFVGGVTSEEVEAMFREERDAEYGALTEAARALAAEALARPGGERRTQIEAELERLRRRLAEVDAVDFFSAPGRAAAEEAVAAAERRLSAAAASESDARQRATGALDSQANAETRGRTWVTRQGVKVDRISSAWLIRRFIDPEARFKFVPAKGYRPAAGELRFDMYDGEYTHEGEHCTFETLLERFALRDRALGAIGEIVHDIDVKDEKFGREEVAGIATLVAGIVAAHDEDDARLERGAAVLDDLYAHFRRRRA